MYLKAEVKKMKQQPWLLPQMKLAQGNQMKITISWGRNDTFDNGRSKFNWVDFSGGVNE